MNTLLILKGPPATGKSTYRNQLVAKGWAYTNLDELRIANPNNKEHQIHDLQRMLILGHMANGKDIIIDNLNLNPKQTHKYECWAKDYGYTVEYKAFGHDLHWSEAVKRDSLRAAKVGQSVIVQSYMNAGLFNDPRVRVFLVDIDGTLADIEHRQHFVNGDKKDWPAFFAELHNDTPRNDVVALYNALKAFAMPVLMSGRGAEYRKETEQWLEKHNIVDYMALFMRGFNDYRADDIIKKELYDKYVTPYFDVELVIDDRPRVIRMWRNEGLHVIDVGKGIEF